MTVVDQHVGPDQRHLETDLVSVEMKAGTARGAWTVRRVEWPHVYLSVAAAPRQDGPDAFDFRIDFTGYPVAAPAVALWDMERDAPLDAARRPKGVRVASIWRADWESGLGSYAAFDRTGLKSHPEWVQERPLFAWRPGRTVSWLLERLSELLNRDDYVGV